MPPKSQQRQLCEEITSSFSTNHPCAQWFSAIERSVAELARQVENLACDVKDLTERVIEQATTMKFIEKEFFPQIREIPDTVDDAIGKHKKECLASTKAIKKAESSSNGNIEERTSRSPQSKGFTIPKFVVYIGVIVGSAIAAGGWLLYYLIDKFN
jgi:hypothetical protein